MTTDQDFPDEPRTEPLPVVSEPVVSDPVVRPRPTPAGGSVASGKRTRRRHRAAGSRRLVAGLAAASAVGLVATLGLGGRSGQDQVAAAVPPSAVPSATVPPTTAPEPVVVIRRTHIPIDGGGTSTGSGSTSSGATIRPSAPTAPSAPPVTAAPRQSAPVTRSSSS